MDLVGSATAGAPAQVTLKEVADDPVEFDPTNGIVGSNNLIRVAVTRDPKQAIPLSGTWFGKAEECLGMTVEVIVRRSDGD